MDTSEDRNRYIRCNMLIGKVLTPLMRKYMQLTNVPPETVYQTIMESYCAKLRSKLSQEQMNILQTLSTDSYEQFDITLMYKIAREKNFRMLIREMPTRKWGALPQPNEIKIGDDIERIRRGRDTIMHNPNHCLSVTELDEFFDKFIDVGKRADVHLKTVNTSSYEQQIRHIQSCPIDPETTEMLLRTQAENKNLRELMKLERFHVFIGREMEEHIEEIRNGHEPLDRITPIQMVIHGLENPGVLAHKINSRKEEIQLAYPEGLFELEEASEGSLMLYLRVYNGVFLSDSLFHTEMDRFIDILFKVISLKQEISVHSYLLILNDDSYETDSSSDEEDNLSEGIDEKKLVLDLSVCNKAFQTDQSTRKNLDSFMEEIVTVLTSQQIIKDDKITAVMRLIKSGGDETVKTSQQIEIDDEMTAVRRLNLSGGDETVRTSQQIEIDDEMTAVRLNLSGGDETVKNSQQIVIDDEMTAVRRLNLSESAKSSLDILVCWLFVSCIAETHHLHTIEKILRHVNYGQHEINRLKLYINNRNIVEEVVSKLHQIYAIHNGNYNQMENKTIEERKMVLQQVHSQYTHLLSRFIEDKREYLQLMNKKETADWNNKKIAHKLFVEVENVKKCKRCRYSPKSVNVTEHRNMIFAKYLYLLLQNEYNIQIPHYYPKQFHFKLCFHTLQTEIKVRATCSYKSDRAIIKSITSDQAGTIWIADNIKNITQLEMNTEMKYLGSKQLDTDIDEIRCLQNNQIILTCSTKILQLINGKLNVLRNFDPYRPSAIHVSNENEIIVGIYHHETDEKTDKPVIIRLELNGETKQIYKTYDAQLCVRDIIRSCTTLVEGNICYIDSYMDCDRGDVVNIDINGNIQWKYRGSPVLNTENHPFNPIEVVTTKNNNLLISDRFDSALHILTPAGSLLTIVYIMNIGRYLPSVMTIDTSGTLWITTYRGNKNTLCVVDIPGF